MSGKSIAYCPEPFWWYDPVFTYQLLHRIIFMIAWETDGSAGVKVRAKGIFGILFSWTTSNFAPGYTFSDHEILLTYFKRRYNRLLVLASLNILSHLFLRPTIWRQLDKLRVFKIFSIWSPQRNGCLPLLVDPPDAEFWKIFYCLNLIISMPVGDCSEWSTTTYGIQRV